MLGIYFALHTIQFNDNNDNNLFQRIIESGLAFIILWNKFECCGINLYCDFMIRKKMWLLTYPQLRTSAPEAS